MGVCYVPWSGARCRRLLDPRAENTKKGNLARSQIPFQYCDGAPQDILCGVPQGAYPIREWGARLTRASHRSVRGTPPALSILAGLPYVALILLFVGGGLAFKSPFSTMK